jgi:hypothetical protein
MLKVLNGKCKNAKVLHGFAVIFSLNIVPTLERNFISDSFSMLSSLFDALKKCLQISNLCSYIGYNILIKISISFEIYLSSAISQNGLFVSIYIVS